MTVSIITHKEMLALLHSLKNPDTLLPHLPAWMSIERLYSLLYEYRQGTLRSLEVAELDAVLELMPALLQLVESGEIN